MKTRSAAVQGLALGIGAALLWWLGRNTAITLDQHGISLGFAFLKQPANFEIGDAPIPYSPTDSFVRAILVGLANTARVSVLGWILAIALGFVLGVMRLAENPAVRGVARGFVEVANRRHVIERFPLMSITIALVNTERIPVTHRAELGDIAQELKSHGKGIPGSVVVGERRAREAGPDAQKDVA